MSWNINFQGVGPQAKKSAQRAFRNLKTLTGGTQGDSPKNTVLEGLTGVVAAVAAQFPDSVIEGSSSGHIDDFGGSAQFDIRVREATQGELESLARPVEGSDDAVSEEDLAERQREHSRKAKEAQRRDTEEAKKREEDRRAREEAEAKEEASTDGTSEGTTSSRDEAVPGANNRADEAVRQPDAKVQPTSSASSAAVGQRSGADATRGKPGSGTPPSNA